MTKVLKTWEEVGCQVKTLPKLMTWVSSLGHTWWKGNELPQVVLWSHVYHRMIFSTKQNVNLKNGETNMDTLKLGQGAPLHLHMHFMASGIRKWNAAHNHDSLHYMGVNYRFTASAKHWYLAPCWRDTLINPMILLNFIIFRLSYIPFRMPPRNISYM